LVAVKIKKMNKFDYKGFVYDFAVPNTNNFLAGDMILAKNSEEEVDMEEDTYEEGEVEPPKIIWQEAKAKCKDCGELITMGWECPACDSKNIEEIQPIYFDDWNTANEFAGKYWEKKLADMKIESTEREA
jgi:hypothetical protein